MPNFYGKIHWKYFCYHKIGNLLMWNSIIRKILYSLKQLFFKEFVKEYK